MEQNTLSLQVELFLNNIKKLEEALTSEKEKNKKIANEYLKIRQTLQDTAQKYQTAYQNLKNQYLKQQSIITQERQKTTGEFQKNESLQKRINSLIAEIDQYKNSYSELLEKENKAKLLIQEVEKLQFTLQELRSVNYKQKVEVEGYQRQNIELRTKLNHSLSEYSKLQGEFLSSDQKLKNQYADWQKRETLIRNELNQKTEAAVKELLEKTTKIEQELTEAKSVIFQQSQIIANHESDQRENTLAREAVNQNLRQKLQLSEAQKTKLEQEVSLLKFEIEKLKLSEATLVQENKKNLLMEQIRFENELREAKKQRLNTDANIKYKIKVEKINKTSTPKKSNDPLNDLSIGNA